MKINVYIPLSILPMEFGSIPASLVKVEKNHSAAELGSKVCDDYMYAPENNVW